MSSKRFIRWSNTDVTRNLKHSPQCNDYFVQLHKLVCGKPLKTPLWRHRQYICDCRKLHVDRSCHPVIMKSTSATTDGNLYEPVATFPAGASRWRLCSYESCTCLYGIESTAFTTHYYRLRLQDTSSSQSSRRRGIGKSLIAFSIRAALLSVPINSTAWAFINSKTFELFLNSGWRYQPYKETSRTICYSVLSNCKHS